MSSRQGRRLRPPPGRPPVRSCSRRGVWKAAAVVAVAATPTAVTAVAMDATMDWTGTHWTAVHQWTQLAANITLLRRPSDTAENISARWRLLHITDAHISLGEAPELHQSGTRRMHSAFRNSLDKHLEPGARRSPAETFRRLLELAARENADAVLLTGDIVNFPHNSSVQYVLKALTAQRGADGRRIPMLYTAGNHDWLVEGLARSRKEQRSVFRRELLRPLYMLGLCSCRHQCTRLSGAYGSEREDVGVLELGPSWRRSSSSTSDPRLLLITLDNSHHEVSGAQAEFVWRELARGLPTLLAVHVPFMLPEVTPKNTKDVLCGDPRYRYENDKSWQMERRERWPRGGAPASTHRFVEDLVRRFAAPRGPLLGVLGGHEHIHRADAVGTTRASPPLHLKCDNSEPPQCEHGTGHRLGLPLHEGLVQYVTLPAYEGGHRLVEIRDARGFY
mmetsp:Transcript_14190/g.25056  ORF Transcript_14190/g.25056 Transcript_14190/m.25056 type:complete len:448 (+) Transcript_14190:87-1430(+)